MAQNNTNNTSSKGETGLLTRFVPEKLKHSALYRWLLRLTRVFQFLSAVISLGIFSSRLYKIYRLVHTLDTRRNVSGAFGAVEGILAAAVLYTLLATLMTCLLRGGGPKWLRWLWVLLDILFVGAFIAVAVLTSPNGGPAGPKACYNNRDATSIDNTTGTTSNTTDDSCNLPWGTFILAIISTYVANTPTVSYLAFKLILDHSILHAITAAFHEVRDRYKQHHTKTHTDQHDGEPKQQQWERAN
ncbi:putative MARVEL domain-containing protein [Seiridium unicorne]|uniref:MARVEL domain-containing protein n=1 Tax=Seiridium unicorne TaxID=138068 RepID=A0ABR2UWJ1_9PEZI